MECKAGCKPVVRIGLAGFDSQALHHWRLVA